MYRLFTISAFFLLYCCWMIEPAHAYEVLILQSLREARYDEAVRGIRAACPRETKRVVLSEVENLDIVRIAREERPGVVVAVGADALGIARKIRGIPVVYVMVLSHPQGMKNATGVSMFVPAENYAQLFCSLGPPVRKVGMIYNPAKIGAYARAAVRTARAAGIDVIAREAAAPRDVPAALSEMRGLVQGLWMLPDPSLMTQETVEYLLLFAHENRLPVVSFAQKYVNMGALASLEVDPFSMGKQAGETALRILDGEDAGAIPPAEARSSTLRINHTVSRRLSIAIREGDGCRAQPKH